MSYDKQFPRLPRTGKAANTDKRESKKQEIIPTLADQPKKTNGVHPYGSQLEVKDSEDPKDPKDAKDLEEYEEFISKVHKSAHEVSRLKNELADAYTGLYDVRSQAYLSRLIHFKLLKMKRGDSVWVARQWFIKDLNCTNPWVWGVSEVISIVKVKTPRGLRLEILSLDRKTGEECLTRVLLDVVLHNGAFNDWPIWPIIGSLVKTKTLIHAMDGRSSHFADY